MKVLGIDPGTQTMGFGIVERVEDTLSHIDSGVIKFKNRDLQESIKLIPSLLDEVTREYQIDTISMETLFFAINPKSVIKLAQFRGALLAYFLDRFDRVEEFSPLEIKKSITGNGRSSKQIVNQKVREILNIETEIRPLDISDALAVAITYLKIHQ